MKQSIILHNFRLSLSGLCLSYFFKGNRNILKLDPCATCNLLKEAGLIEDFTTDKNGEPVILFVDNKEPQGYGYDLWCNFFKSFPFTNRVAELLADFKEYSLQHRKDLATISFLLKPLQAA